MLTVSFSLLHFPPSLIHSDTNTLIIYINSSLALRMQLKIFLTAVELSLKNHVAILLFSTSLLSHSYPLVNLSSKYLAVFSLLNSSFAVLLLLCHSIILCISNGEKSSLSSINNIEVFTGMIELFSFFVTFSIPLFGIFFFRLFYTILSDIFIYICI